MSAEITSSRLAGGSGVRLVATRRRWPLRPPPRSGLRSGLSGLAGRVSFFSATSACGVCAGFRRLRPPRLPRLRLFFGVSSPVVAGSSGASTSGASTSGASSIGAGACSACCASSFCFLRRNQGKRNLLVVRARVHHRGRTAERVQRLVIGKHLASYGSNCLGGFSEPVLSGGHVSSGPGPTLRPSTTGEVPAVPEEREAYELLLIEEADAWFEYLEATRGQSEARYKEVEPWAWARLRQRLRA